MITASAFCSALIFAVSQIDIIGHPFFARVLGADPDIEALARRGMLVFVPVPILVALRGLGQGCHITNNQAWYVGVGTAMRLTTMAVFVFGYAVRHELTGPVLGGFTYLLGIGAETVFVLVTLRRKPQWTRRVAGPCLSYPQFARYALPLMGGSVFNKLTDPLLIHIINTGYRAAENGATFNLMRDTAWVLFSMLMTVQPVVITHATSRQNLRVILRFAGFILAGLTAVIILLALTPLHETIFIGWFKLDNVIIQQLTFTSLLLLIPVPVIHVLNFLITALHTRSGRTGWVAGGHLAGLLMLLAVAWFADLSAVDGVFVAIIGQAGFNLVAAAVQLLGFRNGGLAAATSPVHLASQFQRPEQAALEESLDEAEQVPEGIRT